MQKFTTVLFYLCRQYPSKMQLNENNTITLWLRLIASGAGIKRSAVIIN